MKQDQTKWDKTSKLAVIRRDGSMHFWNVQYNVIIWAGITLILAKAVTRARGVEEVSLLSYCHVFRVELLDFLLNIWIGR